MIKHRTPQEQREFDVDALCKVLEVRFDLPRWKLYRCPKCDAYRVKGEACVMCQDPAGALPVEQWILWSDVPENDWRRKYLTDRGLDVPPGYWKCVQQPTASVEGVWTLWHDTDPFRPANPWRIQARSEAEFRDLRAKFGYDMHIVDPPEHYGARGRFTHNAPPPPRAL